jgi:predicted 2-oxoglutarate/Fe(II)-dependent dioxygenase YbiX
MPADEMTDRFVIVDGGRTLYLQVIHADPLMVRVRDFLTPTEVAQLLACDQADKAGWTPYEPYRLAMRGNSVMDDTATMYKYHLRKASPLHSLLQQIASRIALVCQADLKLVSSLSQILRYDVGQRFNLHKDDADDAVHPERRHRLLTALMYLGLEPNEPGGATYFPDATGGGYRSKPEPGTLVVFRNFLPGSTSLDRRTSHQAEPTKRGPKYSMQTFICEKAGKDGHWD